MGKKQIEKLTLSGIFLAIGLLLPFLTGQIPQIGRMLLPMHIPVLLCGIICGWRYGGGVGFLLPVLRFVLFGMPMLFPTGIAMTFELATYGIVIGVCYQMFSRNVISIYFSLLVAMISGRFIWGIAMMVITGISQTEFTWRMFMSGAILTAIPGILLQLILIPSLLIAVRKMGRGSNGTGLLSDTNTTPLE